MITMRYLTAILFAAMILPACQAFADKPPVKYGHVSLEELKMTTYDRDTTAPAVILCDYGYFEPNNFQFTRVIRIKILKKSGFSWANRVFPPAYLFHVKGATFNLVNGDIVRTDLDSKSIYEETIYGRTKRTRIAMPDVKVGSVIDLEIYFNDIPIEWRFQDEIPVKHSELVIPSNPVVSLRNTISGFEPLKQNEDGHWIAENMPAFKAEPYTSSSKNYMTRLNLDILEIRYNMYYRQVTNTLESLCQLLAEDPHFGQALRGDMYLNQAAREIRDKARSDKEKLRLAHDYIKGYKWNKYESLYTSDESIRTALNKKSGNSADINLALVQLLKKLDFNVKPVLLSTRDNGFLSPVAPSLFKLNYVIACVDLNGERLLMDATEENAPYDLLPDRSLNFFGWSYDPDKSEIVELTTDRKEKETVLYNLNLDNDLQFTGTLSFRRYDYAALNFRNKYKSFSGKEAYLENMLTEYPGLRIRDAAIDNIDSIYQPVKDQYSIVLNNAVEEVNGELYFYPMMLHRLKENPFKIDDRKYPVDFIHPLEQTCSVTVALPDSCEVVSFPEAVKMALPENSAYIVYQVSVVGRSIQFNYKFGINRAVFTEGEYRDLREFYNQILAKQSEPVILKRK